MIQHNESPWLFEQKVASQKPHPWQRQVSLCRAVLKEMGLAGVVNPVRAAKKRENLKKTYKVCIKCILSP